MKKLQGILDRTSTLDRTGLKKNVPKYIVLHSTNSYPTFEDLLTKHKKRNGWNGAGYHLFLEDKGDVSLCRPFETEGAHALGFNFDSIGFCIYTLDGLLTKSKIAKGKKVLSQLQEELGNLQLIPHTLAQIKYLNRLLKENELEKQFPEDLNCVNEDYFRKLKTEIDSFTGRLSTDSYGSLKMRLKEFKNCPGELFNHFR